MHTRAIYVCDVCGFESEDAEEMQRHEATQLAEAGLAIVPRPPLDPSPFAAGDVVCFRQPPKKRGLRDEQPPRDDSTVARYATSFVGRSFHVLKMVVRPCDQAMQPHEWTARLNSAAPYKDMDHYAEDEDVRDVPSRYLKART